MAKTRTAKCMISSPYSDSFIHPAQFLCEIICEKKASTEGKELPRSFWQLPEWLKYYKQQLVAANSLLKKFEWQAVSRALRDKSMYKCWSLRSPFLLKVIEKENAKFLAEQKALANAVTPEPVRDWLPVNRVMMVLPSEAKKKKSKLDLLREMDGE